MTNLQLWNKVKTPNPKYTKEFNRGGGFKGTATNTQYAVMRATELWGPNGTGWGVVITNESYVSGAPILADGVTLGHEIIHVIRGYVWYLDEAKEKRCTSEQFGQTTFVGKNKYGMFTDEEAPKKSVTDMMLKCLSLLGFSADIHLGLWDDNKYVNDAKKLFAEGNGSNGSQNKTDQPPAPKKEDQKNSSILDKWLSWIDNFCQPGATLDSFTAELDKWAASIAKLSPADMAKFNIAKNEMVKFLTEREGGKA